MADQRPGLWERIQANIIFGILWVVATAIAASVRCRFEGREKLDRIASEGKGGLVLPWHAMTVLPIYHFRHRGFFSIVSVSRDGELQNKMLRSRGFRTIRGSSGRHAVRALLESVRCLQEGQVMAFTPDGTPPPKKVQQGTVYLARKSGCPVLPVGVACSPCKRLGSWDRFMIPMPFARAAIAFGDPLFVTADEDDDTAAARIEDAINAAEARAHEMLGVSVERV